MNLVIPSTSAVQFFFSEEERNKYLGTPVFAEKAFNLLNKNNCIEDGVEFYLRPSILSSNLDFSDVFYKKIIDFTYVTVHINEPISTWGTKDFFEGLGILRKILKKIRTNKIIVHANFFENSIMETSKMLCDFLPEATFIIENNGFDSKWGSSPGALNEIFSMREDFKFCLDIAHVKDFKDKKIKNFLEDPLLFSRLVQVHFSYSTLQLGYDPYERKGIKGYGPFHALFSVIDELPSGETMEALKDYPKVIEGVVPKEDGDMIFLKKEIKIAKKSC